MRTIIVVLLCLLKSLIGSIYLKMDYRQITIRAEVTIEEGKIDEYKELIKQMSGVVEFNEPNTINYQFFLNKDATKCVVWETYANSESAIAHSNGIASQTILPKISNISKINRIDVYGNPSEELQKALTNFGAETYNHFTGFSRYLP
jgi:quinol monooxygenase YgiN